MKVKVKSKKSRVQVQVKVKVQDSKSIKSLNSENHFQSVAESATDAIITINKSGKIVFWNKAAKTLFGYSTQEILNKPLNALVPRRFKNAHKKGIERAVSGKPSKIMGTAVELEGLRKDGTEFPIELSLSTRETEDETYFTAIIRDITKRKKTEEQLQKSEEFYRILLSRISDTVLITNDKGDFTWVCPNIATIFGYSKDEVLELGNFKKLFGPDLFDPMELEAKQEIANIERNITKKDGTKSFLLINVKQVYFDNGSILITCRDITERNIVEEKLKRSARLNELVLDSLPHPALLINKDRVVFAANKIAKEIGAVVGGICWQDFGHSRYLSKVHRNTVAKATKLAGCGAHCTFCLANKSLKSKTAISNLEVHAHERVWDIHWVPVEGDIYLHYAIDITERIIAEEKIQKSAHVSELLVDSLPHSAMLINKDRVVLAANRKAKEIGAIVGKVCWKEFGGEKYISKAHRKIIAETKELAGSGAHCTFCQADESLECENSISNPALNAYGKIWDIRWVPLNNDTFLHYAIDITEQKKHEKIIKQNLEATRKIADTLQKSLLPSGIPKIKGLEVKFLYRSATKGAEVGGDFFDIFETPNNNFGIVMADVSGKGVDAATETAKIKYLLRDRAYTNLGPTELLSSINDTLFKQGAERFTALTYGVYDPRTSIFILTNAGNPYPYVARQDRFLKITRIPVSVQENTIYSSMKLKLKEDDVIIMFTDGLTEARRDGDFFGEQRVRNYVKKNKHLSLNQLLSGLIKEANNFAQKKLSDDILIVGIKKL